MGPYHFARMAALARVPGIQLTVVENTKTDDHGWNRQAREQGFELITLSSNFFANRVLRDTRHGLMHALNQRKPDVTVVCGYSSPYALGVSLAHRRAHIGNLVVLWSESAHKDHKRSSVREMLKSALIHVIDGALVAGTPHAEYLESLGVARRSIGIVGNCVDNHYFEQNTRDLRESSMFDLPENFFLFVGRLIPEKNVFGLLHAYQRYRRLAGSNAWSLVIVGSGPEEQSLRDQVRTRGSGGVHFAGLHQLDDLPHYYGHAGCFILPSISEPWGLVVNEAMASGLPVLVSQHCGCARELVKQGVNGFLFDPLNYDFLARLLFKISSNPLLSATLGEASAKIIREFTPEHFARRTAEHLRRLHSSAPAPKRILRQSVELATMFRAGVFRR